MVDLIKCCYDSIGQVSDDISNAVVYLDAGCTESFQFLGAFPLLLEIGARAVCSLENTSPLDQVANCCLSVESAEKVVIITSRLLSDAHRYILRCLSTLQGIRSCTVFTSISEISHSAYADSPLGPDAFHEYELLLVQDYEELIRRGQMNSEQTNDSDLKESTTIEDEGWSELTSNEEDMSKIDSFPREKQEDFIGPFKDVGPKLVVNVHHFPLVLCPFSPRVFVLPSEGSVAEACLSAEHENSLSPGLPPIRMGAPADGEDVPPGATFTAQFLYHLAAKMDLKLEIFSLGDFSNTVGKLLMDMSSLYDVGRRRRSAGLLLIDRTLDLLTPCCHGDSLVDRIFSSLPRRKRRASLSNTKGSQNQLKPDHILHAPLDVQIPLEKIFNEENSSADNFHLLESIEAFLRGWNSNNSAQIEELTNLSKKLEGEKYIQHSESEVFRGSFVSTENFHGTKFLEAIMERTTKDGAVLIKKWLQESLRQENMSANIRNRAGFSSKLELETLVKALAKSQSSLFKHKGIIQLAAATIYSLDEPYSARWDAFMSAEKILNVNAADGSQSLASQICDLINKSTLVDLQEHKNVLESSRGLLTLKDVLLLTVIGYMLAGENFPTSGSSGPFSWQEEHFLQEAILDAIMGNPAITKLKFLQGLAEELTANYSKSNPVDEKASSSGQPDSADVDDDQWESWGDDDEDADTAKEQVYGDMQLKLELRDRVDNLFKFLHKISSLKNNLLLPAGPWATETRFSEEPYSRKCFLYKILSRVLAKYDLPGLEYHSSTVGRLFKSGFGRFGLGQAKPSLADQNIILVFVIGGINSVEVREVQEALAESGRPDAELILGGTTLLTPDNMFELLLGEHSYI